MPGANCSVFGCESSRKHTRVGIFRIPSGKDEVSTTRREAWLKMITRVELWTKVYVVRLIQVSCMFARSISKLKRLIVVSALIYFFVQAMSKTVGKTGENLRTLNRRPIAMNSFVFEFFCEFRPI